jgi:nitroreductase
MGVPFVTAGALVTHNKENSMIAINGTSQYQVLSLFTERWSPDSFLDMPVEPEKLASMLAAARLAPSAHNSQPWRFVLCRKERADDFQRAVACLYPPNQEWAATAPVLILCATATVRLSHRDCRHVPLLHRQLDLGLALMSFIVQGHVVGVFTHPMAGFCEKMAAEVFDIPAAFEPQVMLACGYPNLNSSGNKRGPGRASRRPLADLVFEGRWLEPTDLFKDFTEFEFLQKSP